MSALADVNIHGIAGAFPSVVVLARAIIPQACRGQFGKIDRVGASFEFMIGEQLGAKLVSVSSELVSRFARVLRTRIIVAYFCEIKQVAIIGIIVIMMIDLSVTIFSKCMLEIQSNINIQFS